MIVVDLTQIYECKVVIDSSCLFDTELQVPLYRGQSIYLWGGVSGLEEDLVVEGLPQRVILCGHTKLDNTRDKVLAHSLLGYRIVINILQLQ